MDALFDFLTVLWTEGIDFLSLGIPILGGLSIWEFALGAAVFSLLMWAVMRILE